VKKRSSAPVRALAAIAVACGFVVVVVVIATSLGGGAGSSGSGSGAGGQAAKHGDRTSMRHTPKVYVVQNGDTLTSIAHHTGVPVARIRALNPGVDPQILISGETLKLR
jgi:LysM repeat protein